MPKVFPFCLSSYLEKFHTFICDFSSLFVGVLFLSSSLIPSSPNLWFFAGSLPRHRLCSLSISSSHSPHFSESFGFHLQFPGINNFFHLQMHIFFPDLFQGFFISRVFITRDQSEGSCADLSSLDYQDGTSLPSLSPSDSTSLLGLFSDSVNLRSV